MTLYLVRHGRPLPDPGLPGSAWELDPAGFDDVWALRESGRLPARASWFCAPEPKVIATAQLLTEQDVGVLDDLREGDESGPSAAFRDRVVPAVRRLLEVHGEEDVVLVGHGTAWALVVADRTGRPPDLDQWEGFGLPDLIVLPS